MRPPTLDRMASNLLVTMKTCQVRRYEAAILYSNKHIASGTTLPSPMVYPILARKLGGSRWKHHQVNDGDTLGGN
jgi:hypothetical protein